MSTDAEHPEYKEEKERWKLVRDMVKSNYKEHVILPEQTAGKNKARVSARNSAYVARTVFYNYTLNTQTGVVGTGLQNAPTIELPAELEYLNEGATGNGLTLRQAIKKTLSEQVTVGRHILFTDFPAAPLGLSGEETKADTNLKPLIYMYKTEDVPVWVTDTSTGKERLTLVALRETRLVLEPGTFKYMTAVQYRILQLDDEGLFFFWITDKLEDGKMLQDKTYPLRNGKPWDVIPVTCVGSENNDWKIDSSPLYPIAHINAGHLRNSAALEYNIEAHGRATLGVTSDLTISDWKQLTDAKPLRLGGDDGIFLGKGGDLKLVQLGPNQLAAASMDQKVVQIMAIGGNIITPTSANAPVETTKLNMGAKISPLETMITNNEDGYNQQIRWCAEYLGANPDSVSISLSHDLIPDSADAAMIQSITASWQAGGIPQSVLLDYTRKVDLIPREKTNEEVIQEISEESPLGMGTGFDDEPIEDEPDLDDDI